MKILQINSVCGKQSTGRIVADLYRVAVQRGHEGIIAYGEDTAPNDIESYKIGNDFSRYIHGIKTRFFDLHGFASTAETVKLVEMIKGYCPDIIHLHNVHGYYLNIEILFNYLSTAGIPIVWTLHDCWAFTGHCAYFDMDGCEKWKVECNHCGQKKEYPSSILLDNSNWNYKKKKQLFTSVNRMTIVTPSEWLAKQVKQSYLSKYPVEVINNGIDLNVFKPTPSNFRKNYNLGNKHIILGVASVWDERKGLDAFMKLFKKLGENFKIVLVGMTDYQISSLPKGIIGISHTNNVIELAEIYSAANVFVIPTLEDNFPTVNLEALACGTPVITYNTGGSPEILDSTCGIVVDKGDIGSLINAIKDADFSQNNCVVRAQQYDKLKRYSDYTALYEHCVKIY